MTTGPDAHSIASLLPYDLRVIVSGRLNPPLPADVPDDHPLRDPAAVRILSPSPKARAIRAEAERELKRLLEAAWTPVRAPGPADWPPHGGLTADDLAELTGEVPYRVKDVLRTGPGRTFAVRGEAYLLAHEELVVGARDMLGRRVLGQRRATLHAWAEEWRAGGWPDGTPDYLLHGYFPMLRTAGDLDRMLACALDEVRHDRLQEETGGVAEALAEVRATGEAVLEHGDRAGLVATMLRLGFRRGELTRRAGDIPVELAAAWAAAGRIDRATALVRSEGRLETVHGLCAVACRLLEAGDRSTADELVTEAEGLVLAEGNRSDQELLTRYLVPALLTLGELDRAERRVRAVESDMERGRLLPPLLDALCAAGQYERAVALTEERNFLLRVAAVARVAGALAAADRAGEAEQLVREAVARDPHVAVALLLDGSRALRAMRPRGAGGRAPLRGAGGHRRGAERPLAVRDGAGAGRHGRVRAPRPLVPGAVSGAADRPVGQGVRRGRCLGPGPEGRRRDARSDR